MKLYAPLYYKKFKCIADRCTHSCCIGWEIDIDGCTLEKYSTLSGSYGEYIRKSIDNSDTPCFRLANGERCPHLNSNGLCSIITNFGEDYLCEICREHPRFYNDTPMGKEVGVGIACEEACRIVLSSDDYNKFYVVEELEQEAQEWDFNPLYCRARIFEILSLAIPYNEKLALICEEFNISTSILSDTQWLSCIGSLEYLDSAHRQLFSCFSTNSHCDFEKELGRALAYFVYRHTTQAIDKDEFYMSLGFCLFCERLLCSLANKTDIYLAARIISEELEYSCDNTEAIKEQFMKKIL